MNTAGKQLMFKYSRASELRTLWEMGVFVSLKYPSNFHNS